MNPFDAIGHFALGLIREGHIQGWLKLLASLGATAFVSFWAVLGLSLSGGTPPLLSVGAASLGMALSVLGIWLRSPLTKGIPILYPGKIEAARLEQLTSDGTVYNPNQKR